MLIRSLRLLACSAAFCGLVAVGQNAQAAGFYLQEQSVSGLGAAFAGQVSTPRDASILYFNPAGMTRLDGAQLNLGVNLIAPSVKLKDTGTTTVGAAPLGTDNGGNGASPTPLPNFNIVAPLTSDHKLWAGIGFAAPFGFGIEYDDDFFGQTDSTETELTTYEAYPSIAYAPNDKFSIGGSVIIQYVDADLKKMVDNTGGGYANSQLKGDDVSYGFQIGAMFDPIEGTTLGVNYRSKIKHKLDGSIFLSGPGSPLDPALPGKADLELPDIATIGVTHKFNDKWTGLAQATWFGWSSFDTINPVLDNGVEPGETVQDYQNTWAFAVGAEYQLNDDWVLRAGYQFDETPTVDEYRTTITPDGNRHWISGGATYDLNDKWSLDFAGTYIHVESEKINVDRADAVGNPASTVRAKTDNPHVWIAAVGLNYKF